MQRWNILWRRDSRTLYLCLQSAIGYLSEDSRPILVSIWKKHFSKFTENEYFTFIAWNCKRSVVWDYHVKDTGIKAKALLMQMRILKTWSKAFFCWMVMILYYCVLDQKSLLNLKNINEQLTIYIESDYDWI